MVSLGYEVKTCKISSLVEFSQNKERFSLLLIISEGDKDFIDLGERIFPSYFVLPSLYAFTFQKRNKALQIKKLKEINWKNLLSRNAYIILAACRTGRKLVHFLSRNIDQKVVIIAPLEKIDDIKIKKGEPLGVTFLNKGREVESIEVGASSPLIKDEDIEREIQILIKNRKYKEAGRLYEEWAEKLEDEKEKRAFLEIMDTGCGINKEDISKWRCKWSGASNDKPLGDFIV